MKIHCSFYAFGQMRQDASRQAGHATRLVNNKWLFTGEQWDPAAELYFLRARYYEPGVGRFVSADPFPGYASWSQTQNPYVYVGNNPVRHMDPSGLAPSPPPPAWPLVLWLTFLPHRPSPILPSATVGQAIDFWDWVYRKDGGLVDCDWSRFWSFRKETMSAWNLFQEFVCEVGPERRGFEAEDRLTRELAASRIVHEKLRKPFLLGGCRSIHGREMRFGLAKVLLATQDWVNAEHAINITHFLGSFEYDVVALSPFKARFVIRNRTDRSSGSHIAGRFPKKAQYLENIGSGEEWLNRRADEIVYYQPAVVSILRPKHRVETIDPEGGGDTWQIFTWEEDFCCIEGW